jgi:hypothetical protein
MVATLGEQNVDLDKRATRYTKQPTHILHQKNAELGKAIEQPLPRQLAKIPNELIDEPRASLNLFA